MHHDAVHHRQVAVGQFLEPVLEHFHVRQARFAGEVPRVGHVGGIEVVAEKAHVRKAGRMGEQRDTEAHAQLEIAQRILQVGSALPARFQGGGDDAGRQDLVIAVGIDQFVRRGAGE